MKKQKSDIFFIFLSIIIAVIMVVDLLPHKEKKKISNENVVEIETESSAGHEEETTETDSEETTEEKTAAEETKEETKEETPPETESECIPETIKQTETDAYGEYNVFIASVNSWESDNKYFTQCVCKVENISDKTISEWFFSQQIDDGYVVESGWNGTIEIKNGMLNISPVEWNSTIAANSTVETCGFIVSGSKKFENICGSGESVHIPSDNVEIPSNEPQETTAVDEKPYTPPVLETGTPFANHGKLSLSGTDIVDKDGNKYQLKGPSTHGLQWFPQYVEKETFKYLRDEWGANMIRLAMYTAENGYCGGDSEALEVLIDKGVKACTELGMYVIIDWHILSDGNPNTNKAYAKIFFEKMAQRYSEYNNVIYEICNEPNGVSWEEVKKYADDIIPIIRQHHKDAIIICGTPTWSQDVDQVALNPLNPENRRNVMYALHFYAATHGQYLRDKAEQAIKAGTPVFVSEFSICDASGNGGIDYNSANEWKSLINKYNLSYAGWSLSNKAETSALIKSGIGALYGWTTEQLSDTGIWLRQMISGK